MHSQTCAVVRDGRFSSRLGHACLLAAVGRDNTTSADANLDGTGRKEQALQSRRGHKPIPPGSTLLVAGSLFIGNGLGVTKAPTAFSGGSAKDMLKNIMEGHALRDSLQEAEKTK